jgi:hypothetical protein
VETEERPAVFGFQGEKLGEKKKLTRGSRRAVRGRKKEGTGSETRLPGPQLVFVLGRDSSPRSISYFYFLLSFSFSAFLILS